MIKKTVSRPAGRKRWWPLMEMTLSETKIWTNPPGRTLNTPALGVWGGQRTTCGSRVGSLSVLWVLGVELPSWGLAASTVRYSLSSLTSALLKWLKWYSGLLSLVGINTTAVSGSKGFIWLTFERQARPRGKSEHKLKQRLWKLSWQVYWLMIS